MPLIFNFPICIKEYTHRNIINETASVTPNMMADISQIASLLTFAFFL